MMYLFGGKNYKTNEYINGLWCLNLESFNWKRQELKGYSPSLRENASLVLHQRNMIILYGGRHANNNLNDLHIYKI
jgi:Galactose oxidase, central domain